MSYTFRPLIWTGPRTPAHQRKSRWTFRASHEDTVRLLENELWMINATAVVVEVDYREADIRRDGLPRANAPEPAFPGVRVSFNMPDIGRVQYETDVFETWKANLRAIALGLEALRKVERYGITAGKQQYTGFRAIGGNATPMGNGKMSKDDAKRFIATHGRDAYPGAQLSELIGHVPAFTTVTAKLVRAAAKKLHPDTGGDTDQFKRLQEAKEVLGID